jgi:hypothetical protein
VGKFQQERSPKNSAGIRTPESSADVFATRCFSIWMSTELMFPTQSFPGLVAHVRLQ